MVSDPRSKGGYVLVSLFQGMVQSRLLRHAIDRTQSRSLESNLHTESTDLSLELSPSMNWNFPVINQSFNRSKFARDYMAHMKHRAITCHGTT